MKTKLVTFKAPAEDVKRWQDALQAEGRTLSEVCRRTLERLAKRAEKKKPDASD
jgi:hypothetical protein